MSRRTFTRAVLTLAATLAVLVLWARSHRVMDEWSLATDQGEVRALVIYKGAIHITRAGRTAATRPISYDRHDIPADATWDNLYAGTGAGVAWNHLGFWKIESRPALPTLAPPTTAVVTTRRSPALWPGPATRVGPFDPPLAGTARRSPAPWLFTSTLTAWIVPFWPFAAATAAPLLWTAFKTLRTHHRRRAGHCPRCNYDLRATPSKCPECGWRQAANPGCEI